MTSGLVEGGKALIFVRGCRTKRWSLNTLRHISTPTVPLRTDTLRLHWLSSLQFLIFPHVYIQRTRFYTVIFHHLGIDRDRIYQVRAPLVNCNSLVREGAPAMSVSMQGLTLHGIWSPLCDNTGLCYSYSFRITPNSQNISGWGPVGLVLNLRLGQALRGPNARLISKTESDTFKRGRAPDTAPTEEYP